MGHQELGDVGAEIGNPVSRLDPRRLQRMGQPGGRLCHLAVAEPPAAMDDGGLVGEDLAAPTQESKRCQRGEMDGLGHWSPLRIAVGG